jgi:hypothetical protein
LLSDGGGCHPGGAKTPSGQPSQTTFANFVVSSKIWIYPYMLCIGDAKVKLWKVAISLATIGALATPGIFGIWGFMPEKEVWEPFTEELRQHYESLMENELL